MSAMNARHCSATAALRRRAALVAASAMLLVAGGCTTWKLQRLPPSTIVTEKNPDRIRVTLPTNEKVTLFSPALEGDRVVGWTSARRIGLRPNASYLLTDVRSVETRGIAKGRTAALIAGAGVTALIVAAAIAASSPPARVTNVRWSCPFVYSLTDAGWQLDSGTFGGAIMHPLRRTDVDNLDFARPQDGILRLKLANELDETDYIDAVEVLAVDHDAATIIAPSPDGRLHALGPLAAPTRAVDFAGRDALPSIRAADGQNWESVPVTRDPASADVRDGITMEFPRASDAASARLVVDARNTPWSAFLLGQFVAAHGRDTAKWYASLAAEPLRARALQAFLADEAFLRVSVWTGAGWAEQGLLWEVGPELTKRQVLQLDLTGTSGDTLRVRLDSPASFWLVDFVGLDAQPEPRFSSHVVVAEPPRRGTRALFDLLRSVDGQEARLESGDSMELRFNVPASVDHLARSYVLRTTGWYRLNTPQDGEPDRALLDSITVPGGVARAAAVRMNDALQHLRAAPDRE